MGIAWSPQKGPQQALIDCPVPEIFYGGARGGGKTDGVLGKYAIKAGTYGEAFNAIFFRKELPMLDDAIERSHEIYAKIGAEWHEQKKMWRFPGGGRLRFRPLERSQDAEKYQGQNLTDACVEEAGNYPDPAPIDKLHGALRSTMGVPTQLILTGNPGGPGQLWIKQRYVDPAPSGMRVLKRQLRSGEQHQFVFIPSRLDNNRILMERDPHYVNRLHLVGSEELVRAWLEGDWNAIEGAFFDKWSQDMILKPFEIPKDWTKFRAFDWGSARPFSVGWWAVVTDDYMTENGILPRGAIVRYREWYGCQKDERGQSIPNKGLKMDAEQVAAGVLQRENEKVDYSIADPSIFAHDGGPCIADRMRPIHWLPADNKRVSSLGHVGGWDLMRHRMAGNAGRPMIYCFDTCVDSIRTIPVLQHDETKPEDLDTDAEDHCFAAGTLVDTDIGPLPIEQIVPGKHAIWSAGRWRRNYVPRMTRASAELVRLRLDNNMEITCTPDHKFMDFSGEWRYARDLQNVEVSCDLLLSAAQSKSLTARAITAVGGITSVAVAAFIARYGNGIMGRSQRERISIIRMATDPTMHPTIWRAFHGRTIWAAHMAKRVASAACVASTRRAELLPSGMAARVDGSGIPSISTAISAPSWKSVFPQSVRNVVANIWSLLRRSSRASSVAVPVEPVRCVSVVSAGRGPVYCLDEPATHAFTIEGGLIVHNCADEWRYACASRPWIREPEEDEEPVFEQQLPVGKQIERHITHKRRSKEPERI